MECWEVILQLILISIINQSTQQLPTGKNQQVYGKYCGILDEIQLAGKTRFYNCHGIVWALDEHRLYITGFTFQPSIFNPENITFWIGPAKEPPRFADEIIPSENGLYLEPKEISLKSFLFGNNAAYKIAKKPSAQEVSSLKNILLPTTKKLQTNSTKSTASKSVRYQRYGNQLSNDTNSTDTQKSSSAKEKMPEPHPFAEPSHRKQNDFLDFNTTHQTIATDFTKGLEVTPKNMTANYSKSTFLINSSTINRDNDNDNDTISIDLIVGGGATVRVTRKKFFTVTPSFLFQEDNENITNYKNETISTQNETTNGTKATAGKTILTTTLAPKIKGTKIKPLSWYAGAQPFILEIPNGRSLSEFSWLSVWDHTQHAPIATLLLPSGPGFVIPKLRTIGGFKPTLSKDVRSGPIEIIDTKTIRITNFIFEGDAPGAWFYVGRSLIPVASGEIVPILRENGTYDCDFLPSFQNETLILKLPGDLEATDVFWLSVFCLPYGISFAHVYLPYKDFDLPPSMDFETVPRCRLE